MAIIMHNSRASIVPDADGSALTPFTWCTWLRFHWEEKGLKHTLQVVQPNEPLICSGAICIHTA